MSSSEPSCPEPPGPAPLREQLPAPGTGTNGPAGVGSGAGGVPGWPWWLRRSHGTEQPQPGYKRKRLFSTLCPSRVPGRPLQPLAGGGLAKFHRSASAPAQPARGKPPPRPLQPSRRWVHSRGGPGERPCPQLHSWAPHASGLRPHGSWCPGVPSTPHTGLRGGDPFPSHPIPSQRMARGCSNAPLNPTTSSLPSPRLCLHLPKARGAVGTPNPTALGLRPPSLPELLRAAKPRRAQGPRAAAASPARAGLGSSRAR